MTFMLSTFYLRSESCIKWVNGKIILNGYIIKLLLWYQEVIKALTKEKLIDDKFLFYQPTKDELLLSWTRLTITTKWTHLLTTNITDTQEDERHRQLNNHFATIRFS